MTIEETYEKYKQVTNMTYTELLRWSATQLSTMASLDRSPINRNLRLLRKPLKKWTENDAKDARRTIAFVSRMRKVPKGKRIGGRYSKRDISLKNWAYDPFKK